MVPMIRVAKRPSAIPERPSIKIWLKTFFTLFILSSFTAA
jgi:hypothetical protein